MSPLGENLDPASSDRLYLFPRGGLTLSKEQMWEWGEGGGNGGLEGEGTRIGKIVLKRKKKTSFTNTEIKVLTDKNHPFGS